MRLFQNEPEVVPTGEKVRLIDALARTGLRRLSRLGVHEGRTEDVREFADQMIDLGAEGLRLLGVHAPPCTENEALGEGAVAVDQVAVGLKALARRHEDVAGTVIASGRTNRGFRPEVAEHAARALRQQAAQFTLEPQQ